MVCSAAAGEMGAPARHLQSRLAGIKGLHWVLVIVGVGAAAGV